MSCLLCGNSPKKGDPCLHDDAVHFGWKQPRPAVCAKYTTYEDAIEELAVMTVSSGEGEAGSPPQETGSRPGTRPRRETPTKEDHARP